MPFGILECYKMEMVPGTALLRDQSDLPDGLRGVETARLKHGTGRFSHVLLVPQPSDSPNDPLNWPTWRKDMVLFLVGMSAAVVGAYGPMLGPGFVPIAAELGITVEILSQSTAWLILTLGLCVFFFNPAAKIWGKRPIYVVASVVLLIVSIWGSVANTYSSFLGSRILGALGMAPYEVLVQATISDLYFVHERATRIAMWNLFLLCGIAGAGFISGYIIENLGYKWTFGLCAILFGVFGVGIIFFVPETTYIRQGVTSEVLAKTGIQDQERGAENEKFDEKGMHVEYRQLSKRITGNGSSPDAATEAPYTYVRSLALFTGRYTDAAIWKIFARPFIMFFYPCVLWAFLILRHDIDIYEPEFRLVLMLVVVVLGTAGFYGFGATVHYVTHWSGPVLTYGLANMSLAFASTCVFGYVLDCYPRLAEEAFVAINTRNLLTFGLTYFVQSWLQEAGALAVFNILGSCFLAVCCLTIPLWVFGKRIRSWVARNQFLNEFMSDL
ncbi:hypothetical protein LTR03_010171 [Friedmanniomyces endolithicus]|nr:hypothetical protein LTR03_010171 [Friedmanniomyces endolithicus]